MKIEQAILHRFFEGKTSFEEEVKIKKWLEEDAANKALLLKERKLYDAILLQGKPVLQSNQKNRTSFVLVKEFLKIASVVAIVWFLSHQYYEKQSTNFYALTQSLTVPEGQRMHITLPDGTTVWLNARTTLRYPLMFGKKNRQVFLDGEAHFDVAKDNRRPFFVETAKSRLEVLGTTFNVEDYSEMDGFETMLFNGSVKIIPADSSLQPITLQPTFKAYMDNGVLKTMHVDDYSVYRWREGLICFKNESFLAIMNDFEKYYGMKIVIENEKVQQQSYSGKFRQTDGVDYALRVLQKDIRFKYQRDDENNIIYIN